LPITSVIKNETSDVYEKNINRLGGEEVRKVKKLIAQG
jgi:hypothetical protein